MAYTLGQALLDTEIGSRGAADPWNTILGHNQGPGGQFAGTRISEMTNNDVFNKFAAIDSPYAGYSKGAVGHVATPTGAGQIVGATGRSMLEQGILDPNALYDATSQKTAIRHLAKSAGRAGLRNTWEGFKNLSEDQLDQVWASVISGEDGLDMIGGGTSKPASALRNYADSQGEEGASLADLLKTMGGGGQQGPQITPQQLMAAPTPDMPGQPQQQAAPPMLNQPAPTIGESMGGGGSDNLLGEAGADGFNIIAQLLGGADPSEDNLGAGPAAPQGDTLSGGGGVDNVLGGEVFDAIQPEPVAVSPVETTDTLMAVAPETVTAVQNGAVDETLMATQPEETLQEVGDNLVEEAAASGDTEAAAITPGGGTDAEETDKAKRRQNWGRLLYSMSAGYGQYVKGQAPTLAAHALNYDRAMGLGQKAGMTPYQAAQVSLAERRLATDASNAAYTRQTAADKAAKTEAAALAEKEAEAVQNAAYTTGLEAFQTSGDINAGVRTAIENGADPASIKKLREDAIALRGVDMSEAEIAGAKRDDALFGIASENLINGSSVDDVVRNLAAAGASPELLDQIQKFGEAQAGRVADKEAATVKAKDDEIAAAALSDYAQNKNLNAAVNNAVEAGMSPEGVQKLVSTFSSMTPTQLERQIQDIRDENPGMSRADATAEAQRVNNVSTVNQGLEGAAREAVDSGIDKKVLEKASSMTVQLDELDQMNTAIAASGNETGAGNAFVASVLRKFSTSPTQDAVDTLASALKIDPAALQGLEGPQAYFAYMAADMLASGTGTLSDAERAEISKTVMSQNQTVEARSRMIAMMRAANDVVAAKYNASRDIQRRMLTNEITAQEAQLEIIEMSDEMERLRPTLVKGAKEGSKVALQEAAYAGLEKEAANLVAPYQLYKRYEALPEYGPNHEKTKAAKAAYEALYKKAEGVEDVYKEKYGKSAPAPEWGKESLPNFSAEQAELMGPAIPKISYRDGDNPAVSGRFYWNTDTNSIQEFKQ